MLQHPVAVGDLVTPPVAVDGAPAHVRPVDPTRPSDGAVLGGMAALPGLVAGGEVHLWATPLRVNLRYEPNLARLRLRGELTGAHLTELVRILGVLDLLPAPVEVDLREISVADRSGTTVLDEAMTRRRHRGGPTMTVRHAGICTDLLRAD